MLGYLLKVTLCWAVFYLLYHLLLGKETFFRLNRCYLLGTVLLGLVIPTIEFDLMANAAMPMAVYYLQPITVGMEQLETIIITPAGPEQSFDVWQILVRVYWAGVAIALARFGYGLFQIYRLYRSGDTAKDKGYRFVSTTAPHVPFSFFKNLFWSKHFEVGEHDRQSIVRHEEAHIFQWHSLDVLLLELAGVFCWCSPFVYLYKRALKTTHEYLADAYVTEGFNKKQYGRLLLRQSQSGMQIAISNPLFSSQLKNRIVMMTKTKSSQWATLKYLATVPALALLFLAFSFTQKKAGSQLLPEEKTIATTDTLPDGGVFKTVDEMPRFPGCEEIADIGKRNECAQTELFTFIGKNLKYPAPAKEKGIEGMVVAKFIIEKDGTVSNPEIVRSIGGGCDEEVLRVVGEMPKWVPGTKEGKPVAVEFNLPVKFKMDTGATEKSALKEVDQMPLFSGCEDENDKEACSSKQLVNYIIDNLKYPEQAQKAGVEGTVVVKFVVAEDGTLRDVDVVKGIGGGCDEEALRVVKQMPNWTPGIKEGKAVAVEMSLPFKFALPQKAGPSKAEIFEVFPNPSSENGFNVRFKAPVGKLTLVFYDAVKKGDVVEKSFPKYDGSEQTVRIGTNGLFNNGLSKGTAFVGLYDEKGNVLGSTTVVVQ